MKRLFVVIALILLVISCSEPAVPQQVATPVITVKEDTGVITITCETDGAVIRYTTDGTDPTYSSSIYDNDEKPSITAKGPYTVKAFATLEGYHDSAVATATGEYSSKLTGISVTVEGGTPSININSVSDFTAELTVTATYADGSSAILTSGYEVDYSALRGAKTAGTYTVTVTYEGKSATFSVKVTENTTSPTISFSNETGEVTITSEGATIYYSTNGEPSSSGSSGASPVSFTLTETTTVKAYAVKEGLEESDVSEKTITKLTPPSLTMQAGSNQVTITAKDGESVRYVTGADETNPTATSGNSYGGPFEQTTAATVKAVAYRADCITSDVATLEFTKLDTPVISATIEIDNASVEIKGPEGATVYYTTDDSAPPISGADHVYSEKFTLTQTATVRAIAVQTDRINSDEASKTVDLTSAGVPEFTVDSSTGIVTIKSDSADAIYYTEDGVTTPSRTSTPYKDNGIDLSSLKAEESKTIQAIAVRSGFTNSKVTSITVTKLASPTVSSVDKLTGDVTLTVQSDTTVYYRVGTGTETSYATGKPTITEAGTTSISAVAKRSQSGTNHYLDSDGLSFTVNKPDAPTVASVVGSTGIIALNVPSDATVYYNTNSTTNTYDSTYVTQIDTSSLASGDTNTYRARALSTAADSEAFFNIYSDELSFTVKRLITPTFSDFSSSDGTIKITGDTGASINYTFGGTSATSESGSYVNVNVSAGGTLTAYASLTHTESSAWYLDSTEASTTITKLDSPTLASFSCDAENPSMSFSTPTNASGVYSDLASDRTGSPSSGTAELSLASVTGTQYARAVGHGSPEPTGNVFYLDSSPAYFRVTKLNPIITVAANGDVKVSGVETQDTTEITVNGTASTSVTQAGTNTVKATVHRDSTGDDHYIDGASSKDVHKLSAPTVTGPFISSTENGVTKAQVTISPAASDSSVTDTITYHYATENPTQSSDKVASGTPTFTSDLNGQTVKIIASVDDNGSYVNSNTTDATVYVLAAPVITPRASFNQDGIEFIATAADNNRVYFSTKDPINDENRKHYFANNIDGSPAGTVYVREGVKDDQGNFVAWSALATESLAYTVGMTGYVDAQNLIVFYVGEYSYPAENGTTYHAMAVLDKPITGYNNGTYPWGAYGVKIGMENGIGKGLANSNISAISDPDSDIYKSGEDCKGTDPTIWTQLKNFRAYLEDRNVLEENLRLWFIPSADEWVQLYGSKGTLDSADKTWPHGSETSQVIYWSSTEFINDSRNNGMVYNFDSQQTTGNPRISFRWLEFARALQ